MKWTITNGACTSSDTVSVSFSYAPAQPLSWTAAQSPVCQSSTGITYTVPAVTGATTYTWTYSGTGATINGTSNSVTIDFSASATSGTLSVSAVNGCGTSTARTMAITVTPLPVATFSYSSANYCQSDPNPLPVYSGGGVAGVFSSSAGLVFISTATGQIDLSASTPGTYTVYNTIAAAGGCGVVTAQYDVRIMALSTWTAWAGTTDWFNPGNWGCGLPSASVDAIIPAGAPFYPNIVGSGAVARNVQIDAGASLTITGTDSLSVYGTWTNNGTFTANNSSVLFKGNTTFSGSTTNTFGNFVISATGNLTAPSGNLNVTGNWNNSGTFAANSGRIIFTGGNAQTITNASGETFANVTINKSSNSVTLNNNTTIQSNLTLTAGNIVIGSNTLFLGTSSSNVTISPSPVTSASYIVADGSGLVQQFVNSAGAAATTDVNLYRFPIGDAVNYTPCAIHLKSAATLNSGAFITANVTDAVIPGGWTSGFNTWLSRYWTIEPANTSLLDNFMYESYVYYIPISDALGGDIVGTGSVAACKENVVSGIWQDAIPADMTDTDIPTALGPDRHELRWDNRTSFSRHSGRAAIVLPIELMSFTAEYDGHSAVDVNWITASEINNDFFSVERSADSVHFISIGVVPGALNSTRSQHYSFIDHSPLPGTSYYRLKQTDYDGKFKYSDIDAVTITDQLGAGLYDAFPNPSDGSDLNVKIKARRGDEVLIKINDVTGKECYSQQIKIEDNREQIYPIGQYLKLSPGVYFITFRNDENSLIQKLVVK
ncbi:MAG: T9SS type A sorting domain-containing protein [Bacteroidia bacterium]